MARHARRLSDSGINHVILRGVNRQDLFHDDEDMGKMLDVLEECTGICKSRLHAYCLMTNHIHLLIQTTEEPDFETLAQTMKRIGVRYARYYNSKYDRVGHLFQERYKSEAVETDLYFLGVLRYIHRNPIAAGLAKTPDGYSWSSYGAYITGLPVFVYTGLGGEMLEDQYEEYMNSDDDIKCIDIDCSTPYLSDLELSARIEEALKLPAPTLATLGRGARDEAIRQIASIDGVSYRTLSRVTGLSMGTISRAVNDT